MRILLIGTNKGNVHPEETRGTLRDLQGYVDGYIESVFIPQLHEQGVALIVNEEGVIRALPLNENLYPFFFCGQAFMVGVKGSAFRGLSDKQLAFCQSWISGLQG